MEADLPPLRSTLLCLVEDILKSKGCGLTSIDESPSPDRGLSIELIQFVDDPIKNARPTTP